MGATYVSEFYRNSLQTRKEIEKLEMKFEEFCNKHNIEIGWVAGGWCSS